MPVLRPRRRGPGLPLIAGALPPGAGAGTHGPSRPRRTLTSAFAHLAAAADPPLDALALALAAEFRSGIDAGGALSTLDALGTHLAADVAGAASVAAQAEACAAVLGGAHGFAGDRDRYDRPENSMLDLVLESRRGLPILLSVVYVEAGRRAGLPLGGVGLPGHFLVGHFGSDPPLLIDPFNGGALLGDARGAPAARPWRAHEIALRMLNNLVGAYRRRGDLTRSLRAAEMRLELPLGSTLREEIDGELRSLRAQLN